MSKVGLKWALAAMVVCGVATTAPAQARDYIEKGYLKLENRSETKRKMCVFAKEEWKLLPRKCFTLDPGDSVVWKREKPNERFRVVVYETRFGPDKLLRGSDLSRDTVYVATNRGNGWTQSEWKPRPGPPKPEYRVKFCNNSQPTPVWVAIAAAGGKTSMTEGYWSIPFRECKTINFSERFTRVGGGVPEDPLLVLYRAYTTGEDGKIWGGSEENKDPLLCVNTKSKFALSTWEGGTMESGKMYPCEGENETRKLFRYGPSLDREVQVGRVDF